MTHELLVAVEDALSTAARPLEHDWALVVGSADRRLATSLRPARVVMSQVVVGMSLPRNAMSVAVCVVGERLRAIGVDALVVLRNALAPDAPLLVVGRPEDIVEIEGFAEGSGFSRRSHRVLGTGYAMVQLRR